MSNKPGSRRRLSPAQRRAELLASAAEILEQRGPADLTMEEVARHCGASRALVYRYFASRTDLVHALVNDQSEALRAALPHTSVRDDVDAYLRLAARSPGLYRAVHRGALLDDPDIRATIEASRTELEDGVLEHLGPDAPWGHLVARGWMALLVEFTLEWLTDPLVPREWVRDRAMDALTAMAGR